MGYKPSPRPSFDAPHARSARRMPCATRGATRRPGFVEDWIYVSSELIHAIVFGLPPGGAFRHSESFRTVFAADELLHVLQGTLVLANPETGEVVRAEPGESVFFRRDTWHHGFSYGDEPLRVLEFFAPPPATGTSGAYAQTQPYLEGSIYADDRVLGRLAGEPRRRRRARSGVLRRSDATGGSTAACSSGLLVSTEHLTVGTVTVPAGQASLEESHDGEELLYVTRGALRVAGGRRGGDARSRRRLPRPGRRCRTATPRGDVVAEAIFGVAPTFGPPTG